MNKFALQISKLSLAYRRFARIRRQGVRMILALTAFSSFTFAHASEDAFDELVFNAGPAEVMSSRQVTVSFAEYRFKTSYKGVHPYAIAGWADDSASYFGVGLFYPIELSEDWRLTIASGPGYYDRNNSPRDLGAHIEFFSRAEISRRVWHDHRIGLSIGHISNASINHEMNPGSETLSLSYSIPLHWHGNR